MRLWEPVHTRRCVLRHQLADEVDLRRADRTAPSTHHGSRRDVSMWGVQLSSVASTYQLRERIDFLAPQPRTNPLFLQHWSISATNNQSLNLNLGTFFRFRLVCCENDNTELCPFFHSRDLFGAVRPNGIQLKRTRRHFVISENWTVFSFFSPSPLYFFTSVVATGCRRWTERTTTSRRKKPLPGARLRPNIAVCTTLLIYIVEPATLPLVR